MPKRKNQNSMSIPLIQFTEKGLYCAQGNFYLDPWYAVDNALITHAHSDHARWGNKNYLCATPSAPLLKARLGNISLQSVDYNQTIVINGVEVSFFPAGHVVGSSQIRLQFGGETWVFSGDYKTENDGISGAFEPVPCNVFITESTFGLPIYKWQPQNLVYSTMQRWAQANHAQGITSVFFAYSLGKAQRVIDAVAPTGIPIYVHGSVWQMQEAVALAGIPQPTVHKWTADTSKHQTKGCIVVAPASTDNSTWLNKFSPYVTAACSGWMQVRGNKRRNNFDTGFVLSDHADWDGLLTAIKATNAEKVFVTHGFQKVLSRYLNEMGIEAAEVKTNYGSENEETETEPATTDTVL